MPIDAVAFFPVILVAYGGYLPSLGQIDVNFTFPFKVFILIKPIST